MKAILLVEMPDDMRIEDTKCLHITLFNGLFTRDVSCDIPLKPMPQKYLERDIKMETERDVETCSHGIALGRNLLIEEIEE